MIIITKYPNRRLYDTSKSEYINLDDVKELVLAGTDFRILEQRTGIDVTKLTLVQIVSELENNNEQSLLTDFLLKQLIRFYGTDMQSQLGNYLERSLEVLFEQQESVQSAYKNFIENSPMNTLAKIIVSNLKNDSSQNLKK